MTYLNKTTQLYEKLLNAFEAKELYEPKFFENA
jgi:hypothetical protein